MDAKEIVHRVVEGAIKQLSRRLTQGWDAIKPAGTLAPLPFIAGSLRNCEPALAATIAREAEDMRQGKFHLLGATWPAPQAMPPSSDLLACRSR